MTARFLTAIALPVMLALAVAPSNAQTTAAATQKTAGKIPERPVRRDIPMTRMIQRAFAAGTRDWRRSGCVPDPPRSTDQRVPPRNRHGATRPRVQ